MTEKWRFKLDEEFVYRSALLVGIHFANEWLKIVDGVMTIQRQYAWDGCSPSFKIPAGALLPQGIWLGIWDGPLNPNGVSVSYRASLAHDALCQFRNQIYFRHPDTAVLLFAELLERDSAPGWMQSLYPAAVRLAGPQKWLLMN